MSYQIIGESLASAMELFNINAEIIYSKNLNKWPHFEIWEMDKDNFEKLCSISDKDWDVGPGGWWRYSTGSILGSPNDEFTINGKSIFLWADSDRNDYWKECYDEDCSYDDTLNVDLETYMQEGGRYEFKDIFDYLCSELGASTERNVSAILVDIAKYNKLSLAEVIDKYC